MCRILGQPLEALWPGPCQHPWPCFFKWPNSQCCHLPCLQPCAPIAPPTACSPHCKQGGPTETSLITSLCPNWPMVSHLTQVKAQSLSTGHQVMWPVFFSHHSPIPLAQRSQAWSFLMASALYSFHAAPLPRAADLPSFSTDVIESSLPILDKAAFLPPVSIPLTLPYFTQQHCLLWQNKSSTRIETLCFGSLLHIHSFITVVIVLKIAWHVCAMLKK